MPCQPSQLQMMICLVLHLMKILTASFIVPVLLIVADSLQLVDILIATHHDTELDSGYAKAALRKEENNFIIYMTRMRNNVQVISGFAVGAISVIEGNFFVRIDVLLADRGSGEPTLQPLLRLQFENLRRVVANNARAVFYYLESVPNRVSWYLNNGFTHYHEHDRGGLFFMGCTVEANTLQIGN